MNCCEQTIIPFTDQQETIIPYNASLRDKHGLIPNVDVFHYDSGQNAYYRATIYLGMNNNPPTELRIVHGGKATGFIKLF